ncbi:MAG: HD domain-containing protein [Chloroflexota bacterium]
MPTTFLSDDNPDLAPLLDRLRTLLQTAFAVEDPYHGVNHALDVERYVRQICDAPDIAIHGPARDLLRAAALLHDIGYSAYQPDWSPDRREHIRAGLDIAARFLAADPATASQTTVTRALLYLIAHHDDTNFKFPTALRDGEVVPADLGDHADMLAAFEQSLAPEDRAALTRLLCVLREADALAATDTAGAERTFGYSVERGLPVFAPGNPLNAWCWEESAVSNVRIAARRLLLDATSEAGKSAARRSYAAAEAVILDVCRHYEVPYIPETAALDPVAAGTSPVDGQAEVEDFRLLRYIGWNTVVGILRGVAIIGDRSLKPYATARITASRLPIASLRPAATYALERQIAGHRALQRGLQREYALSLFDLTGALDYVCDGRQYRISPPLVETYFEPSEGQRISVIVDGLHRVMLARELGIEEIWVIEISDIPEQFPLVPLPLTWDDVRLVSDVPPTLQKRRFRFPTLESFPDISGFSQVQVNEENFLYFFYRDLSLLGSDGIRTQS